MGRKDGMIAMLKNGKSLQEVADIHNLSKQRILQIVGIGVARCAQIRIEKLVAARATIIRRLLHGETKQSIQKQYKVGYKAFNKAIMFEEFISTHKLRRCYRHSPKNTPEYVSVDLFTPSGLKAGVCQRCQREKQTEHYQRNKRRKR